VNAGCVVTTIDRLPSGGGLAFTPIGALILRVRHGDAAAFEAVFARLSPWVLLAGQAVLGDQALAEQFTRGVMVEIWRTACTFDPSRTDTARWVGDICRQEVDRFHPQSPSGPERSEPERVRQVLRALSDGQVQCIRLAVYRGYTYPEIAERLQLPLDTVRSRIRDGLLGLQSVIAAAAQS
jgi:RNA polymerase sigma-70 factor, ECF subfamily